jgi:hypothetical protein
LPLTLSQVAEVTHFVARQTELTRLHEILGKKGERRTAIIHGLGGMGKTQLAIAYVKCHHFDYSATIWFDARDEIPLKQGFVRAAERIFRLYPSIVYIKEAVENRDMDECVTAVRRWLDEPRNDRWLLVFDNYDDPKLDGSEVEANRTRDTAEAKTQEDDTEFDRLLPSNGFDIRQYFPDSYHGAILVTTRSSNVKIGELVQLQKLQNIDESLEILSSTSNRQDLAQGK